MKRRRAKSRSKNRAKQGELPFKSRGGMRTGAGRKPNGEKAGVSHLARAPLASRFPVHANIKLRQGLPSLRRFPERRTLIEAFRAGAERFGFRLVHYSIQTNHLHFIAEAKDRRALSRGMQGLLIRVARRLNKLWRRKGRVFADRYYDRILKSPTQVRRALVYVLHNAKKHGKAFGRFLDAFASGVWFDGWRDARLPAVSNLPERPTAEARTWLLEKGWRRFGLIGLGERPA